MTGFDLGPALLFCPGDRPDRFAKAAARADAVILDLEDAVAPDRRAFARAAIREHPLDAERTVVRINALGSPEAAADLAMLADTGYRLLMVPKAESAVALDELDGFRVIALCETAAGVLAAPQLARHPLAVALMWGAEDLVASLGGTSSRGADGRYRDVARHARSSVLLAAAAAGRGAIDAVHLDIGALDALSGEAADAAASGFDAVACIHPGQVEVIRAAYLPTGEEVARAREVLAADTGGVFREGGRMIDAPVLAHAREVLRRASSGEGSG